MGRYSVIKIQEVISSAKLILGIFDTTEFDNFLTLFGREGARHLRALSVYKKHQCTLDIVDNKTKLPDNFYRLLAIRFHKDNVTSTAGENVCFKMLYVDKDFLCDCNCNLNFNFFNDFTQTFQIVSDYIHYNSDVGQLADKVELAYIGLNTDNDGNLIIYEDYERALRAYMCYNFALAHPERFNIFLTTEFKKQWMAQKAEIKGSDVANDFQNNKWEVQAIFTALLASPLANFH